MPSQESTPQTLESNRQTLQSVQESLNLPESVVETALMIYKQSYQKDLYHGRPINDILSACLHLACRMTNHAVNPTQIATEFNTSRKNVLKTSRHFESKLGLKTAPVDPAGFIDQFSDALSLSDSTQTLAHNIFETFLESGQDSGKSPTGIAAGAIYAATRQTDQDHLTQRKISEVADVSEVTIRNLYKIQEEIYNASESDTNSVQNHQLATDD